MASNLKVKKAKQEIKVVLRRGRETLNGVTAMEVDGELTRIYKRDGELRTRAVLDEARPDDAPLHPVFEWDDSVAAENWRITQARDLIRSVEVVKADSKPERKWVHVPNEVGISDGAYHPPEVIVQTPDMFALALGEAQARLTAAENSVRQLKHHAESEAGDNSDQLAKIAIAMQALHTAGVAVQALH